MAVSDILKVIYAPHKVFKEIIQNPRYVGVLILLIIFAIGQIGTFYMVGARQYFEQTAPAGGKSDEWTQNAALWQANPGVTVSNNTVDYINATGIYDGTTSTYYGTTSIEFTIPNASSIRMELNSLDGSVNCGNGGFKNVSFNVKIVSPQAEPENVSLYLNSLSGSDFYYDLTSAFSSSTANVWNNITVTVGSGAWVSSNSAATWENITGLKLEFKWPSNSTIDMRIDGLFFRGIFENRVVLSGGLAPFASQAAISGLAPFIFEWILLTGLLYALIKVLKGNVTWRPLMVAVGFALVTLVIQAIILVVVYSTLPNLYYPLEVLAAIPGALGTLPSSMLNAIAFVTSVIGIIQIGIYVWTVALGAVIARNITVQLTEGSPSGQQFSWMKSISVSGVSFLLTILISSYLLGV